MEGPRFLRCCFAVDCGQWTVDTRDLEPREVHICMYTREADPLKAEQKRKKKKKEKKKRTIKKHGTRRGPNQRKPPVSRSRCA